MKKNLIILWFILFSLSACVSPYYLGLSKAEWDGMDDDRRAELIHNYRELHSAKKSANSDEKNVEDAKVIHVSISEGKAMMPPFTESYAYQPVSFQIRQGSCQEVLLKQKEGKHKVEMEVCFKKGILLLDPSHYDVAKLDSSARLHRSPLWRSGFSYSHINTTGYVRLHDASIRIHD